MCTCYRDPMNERLTIPGPAGGLEARRQGDSAGIVAVLCHPHPLYGGSMDDGVLALLSQALGRRDIDTIRFNFRGVGSSEGRHDGDGGEVDDLLAVITWVQTARPASRLLLGGYSFGAATVCQLLGRPDAPSPERVILVAPPVGNLAAPEPDLPTDVFVGDADAFVDATALQQWQSARVHVLPGADHFFSGQWEALEARIDSALA